MEQKKAEKEALSEEQLDAEVVGGLTFNRPSRL